MRQRLNPRIHPIHTASWWKHLHGPGSAIGLALLLGSCGGSGPDPTLAPLPGRARLYADDSGGIQDSLRRVVRNAEAWEELWADATSRRADPPARPEVDFERDMVVVVAAGPKPVGAGISVDSVGVEEQLTPRGDHEEVLKVVVRTEQACTGFEADVYPLEIVRVPRFGGPVVFVERISGGGDC